MKFTVSFFGVLFLLAVAFGPEIYAGTLSPMPEGVLMDEELMFQDIDSVYSASKYDQKVSDAPAKISIVTADEIRRYGYRDLYDILKSLPGFYVTADRNYGYIGVRGFGLPGDYNTKILILIDGIRINENIYDSAIISKGFNVDPSLIKRVEVVRGPGSTLYGSNAFLAVVNVITKSGRDLEGGEVSASLASQETYTGRLAYGRRLDNGVELIVSGTYNDSAGNSSLYFPEYDYPETNNGVAENTDDSQFETLFGKVSFKDWTATATYNSMEKGVPTGSYGTFLNDPRNRTSENQFLLDAKYQYVFSSILDFTGRLSYNKYWYDGGYVYDYNEDRSDPDLVVGLDEAKGEWWGIELLATWDIHAKHRLLFGGEYRDVLEQWQYYYEFDTVITNVDSDIDAYGLFIQDEISIIDSLSVYLGARYDYYTDIGGEISPRAAAVYKPVDDIVFKLIYSTAYRAPNPYELYYEDNGAIQQFQLPNPNLEPETIEAYELVTEIELTEHLRFTTSFFRNTIEDIIANVDEDGDEIFQFQNTGTSESQGVEIELYGKWESGWDFAVSFTYQDAEDTQGDWLSNSPRQMLKFNLNYPLPFQDLFTGALETQYVGEVEGYDGSEIDGYFLTNLMFTGDRLFKNIGVQFGIYNLFDEKYSHTVSDAHYQYREDPEYFYYLESIEQDGRTYILQLNFSF